jgi:hypothetical protein
MRVAAEEAGRDPDDIEIVAGAGGKGDALYGRIEQLAALGVDHTIVPALRPDVLAGAGSDLRARFG